MFIKCFDFVGNVCFINNAKLPTKLITSHKQVINMENTKVKEYAETLFQRFPELRASSESIFQAYSIIENSFVKSGMIFLCGNGGSAADAEHITGELSKGFILKRELPESLRHQMNERLGENMDDITGKLQMGLKAMVLSAHQSLSTAFTNDVDPLLCYAQQLFAMASENDCIMGITTSGNAENILNAFKVAGGLGMKRILLTGEGNGKCAAYADCIIHAPAKETYRVQEYHLPIYHTLCMMLEERFFGKK